jgi:hypothetical protein
MSKAIYFAGVSRVAGELKFRTAADDKRMAQLVKLGDTDVEMSKIHNYAENKAQAAQELLDRNFANGRAEIQALLESVAGKTSAPRKTGTVRVRARKIKISKTATQADDIKLTPRQAAKVREEFNARLKEAYEAN